MNILVSRVLMIGGGNSYKVYIPIAELPSTTVKNINSFTIWKGVLYTTLFFALWEKKETDSLSVFRTVCNKCELKLAQTAFPGEDVANGLKLWNSDNLPDEDRTISIPNLERGNL